MIRPGVLSVLLLAGVVASNAGTPPQNALPSLDRLQERVLDHWTRLANQDRQGAAALISDPDDRDDFLNDELPAFSNPRIVDFDLNDYPERVRVGVQVDLLQFDWRVDGTWIAENGDWYLELGERDELGIYSAPAPPENANEERIRAFESNFSIGVSEILIPDDAFDRIIDGEIPYRFDGERPIRLRQVSGPSPVSVSVNDIRSIPPGEGVIRYRVVGSRLVDDDLPDVVLRMTMGDLSSDVVIPVTWNGRPAYRYRYVTEAIEAGYQGEIVLEIENLGEETWEPGYTEFMNGRLRVARGPEGPIGPGETARYVFETTVPYRNSEGRMIVNLATRRITIPYPEISGAQ